MRINQALKQMCLSLHPNCHQLIFLKVIVLLLKCIVALDYCFELIVDELGS